MEDAEMEEKRGWRRNRGCGNGGKQGWRGNGGKARMEKERRIRKWRKSRDGEGMKKAEIEEKQGWRRNRGCRDGGELGTGKERRLWKWRKSRN